MQHMKSTFFSATFLCLAALASAQNFGGNPANTKWQKIENKTARVIFPAGLDSQASRILEVNTKLNNATLASIGSRIRQWNIVLQNKQTIPNAYVRLAPVMSEYYMTPPQNSFDVGSLRWDDNLAIHENRHIQQFSSFNHGFTKLFSALLGQEGQLLANGITIPDYFFEGDAVYQETLVSNQGRGRLPAFFNTMKSLWLQQKHYSWMKLRSGSYKVLTPDHYELGYILVGYGYEKYGIDFWRKVTTDAVNFKGILYPFNAAIARHSGVTYKSFRNAALEWYRQKILPQTVQPTPEAYLTKTEKNNVVNYTSPVAMDGDSLLVQKNSYREPGSFYILTGGKQIRLRVKDVAIDNYFSYKNGLLVYAAYRSDVLRANRNYSELCVLNVYSNTAKRLTDKTRYFSPDINAAGDKLLVVDVRPNGTNSLHLIDAATGNVMAQLPNNDRYFFTYPKFINDREAVTAVRNAEGKMALVKVDLQNGSTKTLTAFSYDVLGYPYVKGDTVYFTKMLTNTTQVADVNFAYDLKNEKLFKLTNNINGTYQPAVTAAGALISSTFTADGYHLRKYGPAELLWQPAELPKHEVNIMFADTALHNMLQFTDTGNYAASPYHKSTGFFNFHSARPILDASTYGYAFYSDNVLSNFSSIANYTYNRNDRSSAFAYNLAYAGAFPFLRGGLQYNYNRRIDTSATQGIVFNSAKLNAGFYIPLNLVRGRTYKNLLVQANYNMEQLPYRTIGKNVFTNKAFTYMSTTIAFTNRSQTAKQFIFPKFAQTFSVNYRQGFNYFETKKLVANTAMYLPGLAKTHSIEIVAAAQKRDTLPDFFSNTFAGARGYEPLNSRQMWKFSGNYHFPIAYPDAGVGNIFFLQRIRANVFYDFEKFYFRRNGFAAVYKPYTSAGTEIFLDGKLWNALEAGIGVRYSRLLQTDLQNPNGRNRFEIVLPVNLIPD